MMKITTPTMMISGSSPRKMLSTPLKPPPPLTLVLGKPASLTSTPSRSRNSKKSVASGRREVKFSPVCIHSVIFSPSTSMRPIPSPWFSWMRPIKLSGPPTIGTSVDDPPRGMTVNRVITRITKTSK